MYLAAFTKWVNAKNKVIQKSFGVENKYYRVIGYWNNIYFIDEAHCKPSWMLPKAASVPKRRALWEWWKHCRIFDTEPKPAVYMYTYINYYEKWPLEFYNNEKDMLSKPKIPRKPRKSKYEDEDQYAERVREWEANKLQEVKQNSQGNHMRQKFYTKNLLPKYTAAVQLACSADLEENS
jgi:hypothetical protein